MTDNPAYKELCEIQEWLANGNLDQLEFTSQVVDGFPHGKDGYFGLPWIMHAASCGCLKSVNWMIEQGVNLKPDVDDGYPLLLSCIEQDGKEKYQILEAFIASGADINERGINGWTPLHMAAIRDDERSMSMLLSAGADTTITTLIDDDTTAEEEARNLGHLASAEFIANFAPD
ncbi:ankyrin repeat domain-containing protein [Roseovarius sp.]|uniref:ankyrin repeat domain-containing protein n=1 Tax=Roseovarius sp. TaxID=1486281 RepID=UPI0025D40074|nr:ankyrin repeat domain-containing protein [Roseovarius sp.]